MRSCRWAVILALLAQTAVRPALGAPAQPRQSAPAPDADAPLRLGMVHPQPRLCVGQEHRQRDVRVLRLAYGVALTPAERVAWPWYLSAGGGTIALRAGEPFAASPAGGLRGSGAAQAGSGGLLSRWAETVQGRVPALAAERDAAGLAAPALRVRNPEADPWLASRMNGSALLPFQEQPGAARPCRSWPAGVELAISRGAVEAGRVRYALRRKAGQGMPAIVLTGYGGAGALWADFSADRIDVALLDSGALQQPEFAGAGTRGGAWGVQAGTSQVILRLGPKWEASGTAEARRALSQAINRPALAGAADRGAFRAARAFLEPVLAAADGPAPEALHWDSALARKRWLALAGAAAQRRVRMAVLNHPLLEVFARRIAGQWQTTLGLVAVPELVDADRLMEAWNGGGYDALLEVADLDDGSLQDLWSATLGAAERGEMEFPGPDRLDAWERRLRKELPYLPLLTGVEIFLARGENAAGRLRQVCPACAREPGPPGGEN